MIVPCLLILVSFGVLFLGAELLVRGGASMALKLGLTPLVVGLTVVAYGTSMPELIVSLKAAMIGQSDIAIGNVVGSNIFNVAVILGLAAMVYPVNTSLQVLRFDAPLVLLVTLLTPLTFLDGKVDRIEGIGLLIGALVYTVWTVRMAKKDVSAGHEAHIDMPEIKARGSLWMDVLFILLGLGTLAFGSRMLVDNAVIVATSLGVSEAIIGLTIVAAGTSMPELATTVVAAIRKQSDIALGNVIGSNLFNLLFVLGGAAAIQPVKTTGVQRIDLAMMMGTMILVVPLLATGKKLNRWEGGVLVAGYLGYLWIMWPK